MLQCFYPKEYLDSAYLIDFEEKYGQGYRGIIFDIDNTLVPHGLPADERAESLFKRLKAIGYKVTMLSNNKEPRVKMFCDRGCPLPLQCAQAQSFKVQAGNEKHGDRRAQHAVCGRPDIYRCVGGKQGGDLLDPGKTDPPQRGDTDRFKALS